MATATVVVQQSTASKSTFLSTVVDRLKAYFKKLEPVAKQIEQVGEAATREAVKIEPIVDTALVATGNAAAASLYNTVSGAALDAETAAAAIGQQSGSGTSKAAAVLSNPAVQAAFTEFEQAVGVQAHSTAQQLQYVNSVVATLDALNASAAAAQTAATAAASASNA